MSYLVGQRITVTGAFVDSDGDAINPSSLEFRVRKPDGTTTTYADDDAAVSNPATGTWALSYLIAQPGWHDGTLESDGTGQEAVSVFKFHASAPSA